MNICQLLDQHVSVAFGAVKLPKNTPTVIKPSARINFGHYQVNGVMGAAKKLRTNPRALAMQIVEQLDLDTIANKVEVAGPGFINIYLKPAWLAEQLEQAKKNSDRIGVNTAKPRMTVVVDYSGPNLAKEMHVGHLRSSIIGDAVVRVLEFLGHTVIRQNHVGDWGTQFGMLIAHMQDQQQSGSDLTVKLADLETFYREAKLRFDQDADFATAAREYVVKLQSGDEQCKALWQQFIDISLQHCDDVYQQLNVSLQRSDVMPESAYNTDLPHVISDLDTQGLLTHSDGAQVVFLDELQSKDGSAFPAIVQKSDGGYLYATSDLAALRYRHTTLQADRVMYFVDARQNLHLQSVFLIAQKAGFVSEAMLLEHLPFGTMMGKDGKPFKTRAGGTVKLTDLLDEAEQRAYNLVSEKNPDLDEAEKQLIAHKVGIAAVKYADLSKNRSSDYIFNWDSMLSFEGNTAPYLQYAYARINSIFRKAGQYNRHATLQLDKAEEQQLGLKILQFEEALQYVAKEAMPNMLCNYLYELSSNFMSFYEACPILKADQAIKDSRLKLAGLTADTLKIGLDLLGIEVMERM